MQIQKIAFKGMILERGFWLYIWRIRKEDIEFLYVGRTGDSSSRYAASPFSRLSRHLDTSVNASANMLLRHIKQRGLNPIDCSFEMFAIGPIFEEQSSLTKHLKIRDIVSPLERWLASYLRNKGFSVVGNHPFSGDVDEGLLSELKQAVDEVL